MKFFTNYLPTSTLSLLINDENDYAVLRRKLLYKPTINEYQIASRIATTIETPHNDTVDSSLIQESLDKESKWLNKLIIHYIHEKRLQNYKKDIRLLWNRTFEKTPIIFTKLIIGNRNSPNLTHELVHRRPSSIKNPIIHKS
jgi:type II secretory pathway predicted ATPase ExeA